MNGICHLADRGLCCKALLPCHWRATSFWTHSIAICVSSSVTSLNWYLHDLLKQCAMILVSCEYRKNPKCQIHFVLENFNGLLSLFSNVGTSCITLHIPYVFFFPSFKASASFAYIAPWAVGTRYFIDHVWLKPTVFGKSLLLMRERISNSKRLFSTWISVRVTRQASLKALTKEKR